MWVFDGEEWTQDEGAEGNATRETTRPQRLEEFETQLQVVEVTELRRKRNEMPPLPRL